MKNSGNYNKNLDFNGGWTMGEASHHISKKLMQKVNKDKSKFKRRKKFKKDFIEEDF